MSGTQRSTPSLSLDSFPLDITTERTPRPPNSALPLHYPSTGRRYTYMAARGPTMDYSTPPSTVHYTTTTGTRLPTSSNKSSSLGRVSPPPSITCLSSIHLRMLRLRIWTSTMCVPLSSTFFFCLSLLVGWQIVYQVQIPDGYHLLRQEDTHKAFQWSPSSAWSTNPQGLSNYGGGSGQ